MAESKVDIPSEPLLGGGRIESRLRVFLASVDSSNPSVVRWAVSWPGELGSDLSFQGSEGLRQCVDWGLSVSSPAALMASWHTRITVGSVLRTNWLRVILDSISAKCRSVFKSKME